MKSTLELVSIWLRSRFGDSERGASLVEYALLVALIAVVCAIAVGVLGQAASESYSSTASGFAAN